MDNKNIFNQNLLTFKQHERIQIEKIRKLQENFSLFLFSTKSSFFNQVQTFPQFGFKFIYQKLARIVEFRSQLVSLFLAASHSVEILKFGQRRKLSRCMQAKEFT